MINFKPQIGNLNFNQSCNLPFKEKNNTRYIKTKNKLKKVNKFEFKLIHQKKKKL